MCRFSNEAYVTVLTRTFYKYRPVTESRGTADRCSSSRFCARTEIRPAITVYDAAPRWDASNEVRHTSASNGFRVSKFGALSSAKTGFHEYLLTYSLCCPPIKLDASVFNYLTYILARKVIPVLSSVSVRTMFELVSYQRRALNSF